MRPFGWNAVCGFILLCPAVAGEAAPFSDGFAPSVLIHVATNGSDATGNGSEGQPYRTIVRAAQDAVPGVAITLGPGTYAGGTYLGDLAGTNTAPVWIRGASPTNRPLLQGGGEGLHLTRARYVVVENLEIAGAANNGLNADDGGDYADPEAARFLVFSNLYVHDIGGGGNQDGLKLSGIRDFWVLNSEFTRCGGAASGSGVDMVGCHRGVIRGCYFHQLSANAVQCKGGSSDIEISACRIEDAGHRGINIGGSTGFEYFRPPLSGTQPNVEARNIRILANLFHGCTAAVAFVGCVDSAVANNTIHDPGRWVLRILQETTSTPEFEFVPCYGNQFNNNLVYFNRGVLTSHANIGPNTDPDSFVYAHNLWYAHDNPPASEPTLPGVVVGQIAGADPQLAAPQTGDYAITLQSPAAVNGHLPAVAALDFNGQPYLDPPSRGALEITGDTDGDGLPDAWEMRHLGLVDYDEDDDPDHDRVGNLNEYRADTHPGDPDSVLRLFSPRVDAGGVVVGWEGGQAAIQYLERADQLGDEADWAVLFTNHPPTPRTNEHTAAIAERSMYRLRARRP